MSVSYLCPVCNSPLKKENGAFKCQNSHCFDISKEGYVNLIRGSGKKGHGDDKLMVKARRDFLSKGYYGHLRGGLCKKIADISSKNCSLLDSGCGEGYYTQAFAAELKKRGGGEIFGVDLSKEALKLAAKTVKGASFAAASVYRMPFPDESFDIVTSVFAPLALEEFKRVLKKEGYFITAVPLENHLYSLKKAVYNAPYKNKPEPTDLKGFTLTDSAEVKKEITLTSKEDVKNLFKMTPYYYKTSSEDQAKLDNLETLTVETEFIILVYKKY